MVAGLCTFCNKQKQKMQPHQPLWRHSFPFRENSKQFLFTVHQMQRHTRRHPFQWPCSSDAHVVHDSSISHHAVTSSVALVVVTIVNLVIS
jgi:hypothetical protein